MPRFFIATSPSDAKPRARQRLAARLLELGFRVKSVADRHGESSRPMYGKEGFRYPLSSKYNGQAAFALARKRSGRRGFRLRNGRGDWAGPDRSGSTSRDSK